MINTTSNYVLTELERGVRFDDAVAEMQARGIAESDPSLDLDGWDAAAKTSALSNVWFDARMTPQGVARSCIGPDTAARAIEPHGGMNVVVAVQDQLHAAALQQRQKLVRIGQALMPRIRAQRMMDQQQAKDRSKEEQAKAEVIARKMHEPFWKRLDEAMLEQLGTPAYTPPAPGATPAPTTRRIPPAPFDSPPYPNGDWQIGGSTIIGDPGELSDARWFSRAELRAALADGSIWAPPSVSIARRLIDAWLDA